MCVPTGDRYGCQHDGRVANHVLSTECHIVLDGRWLKQLSETHEPFLYEAGTLAAIVTLCCCVKVSHGELDSASAFTQKPSRTNAVST
mgnify:CR=1 FL=1